MRALWLLALPNLAMAADLTWQGRVLDTLGAPIDGETPVTVVVWDAATNGTAVHTDGPHTLDVESGYVSVALDVPDSVLTAGDDLWIEVILDGSVIGPRQLIHEVPRAATAGHVQGYVDLQVEADVLASPACTIAGRMVFDAASATAMVCDGSEYVALGGPALTNDGSTQAKSAQSCRVILAGLPESQSGVYWLDPDADGDTTNAFQTECDMQRDGGGWTLVMQNNQAVQNPTPTFAQSTGENVVIVGGPVTAGQGTYDLIIGLAYWNNIGTEARIEMGTSPGNRVKAARFESINLQGATYKLQLSAPILLAGTSSPGFYVTHGANQYAWSTKDQDNDVHSTHCSVNYGDTPWWYGACWSGSMWGHSQNDVFEQAHWISSSTDQHDWGAVWIR